MTAAIVPLVPLTVARRDDRTHTGWTFLSNHAHVLVCIADDPDMRMRDIATTIDVTERTVFGILDDLEAAGVVRRERIGRRSRYSIDVTKDLRHSVLGSATVASLLAMVDATGSDLPDLPEFPELPDLPEVPAA